MADPARFAGSRQLVRRIQDAGNAVVALSGITPFEQPRRGNGPVVPDLGGDEEFVHALMGKAHRVDAGRRRETA